MRRVIFSDEATVNVRSLNKSDYLGIQSKCGAKYVFIVEHFSNRVLTISKCGSASQHDDFESFLCYVEQENYSMFKFKTATDMWNWFSSPSHA